MDPKYDPAFLEILREERNITSFLDSFFGFLCRCTDFFVESTPDQRLGFPPGVAEELIVSSFRKWQNLDMQPSIESEGIPAALEEVVVADGSDNEVEGSCRNTDNDSNAVPKPKTKEPTSCSSDCYNGASYENYKWSQSISDLEVLVMLPEEACTSKNVRVELSPDSIDVAVRQAPGQLDGVMTTTSWRKLLSGRFAHKIKSSESYWCLEPGKHISLHLEKSYERWWESLIEGEPRIELSKIDCTRSLEEMAESEQMKVEELMWNQRRKSLGQPTSDQIRTEQMLQRAWDADGSPFKGTEYDPSLVKFN